MQITAYITGKKGWYGSEVEITENSKNDGTDNKLAVWFDGIERSVTFYVSDDDASVMMRYTDMNGDRHTVTLGAVSAGV